MAKELREKLKLLEESLKRSSSAKDRAVEILDNFESRYLQMEDDVNKMNKILDVLKLTHDNIEKTIQSIDSIIAKYNTPKAIEKRIENGVKDDLETFMEALDQRDQAEQFFSKHMSFKNAKETVTKLSEIKKKVIEKLENEFNQILKTEPYPIDPYRLIKPLEEGLDLFPEEAVKRLVLITNRLNSFSAMHYRQFYVKSREAAIKDLLGKITLDSLTSEEFIFYMRFYLQLLKAERDFARKLCFRKQTDQVFTEAVQDSLDLFIQKVELLSQGSQTNEKIFVLLKVFDIFNQKLRPEFRKILEDTVLVDKLINLSNTFKIKIRETLEMHIKEIRENDIEVFPDGAVHQATTNAIAFLRKLFEYSSVEEIDILKAIDYNITVKAKLYSNANLTNVFLLNNHYYLYTKLKESKFKKLVTQQEIEKYQNWVEEDAKRYLESTWGKVLSSLNNSDSKLYVDKKGKYSRQTKKELKKRLTNFNNNLLSVYHTHRSYSLYNLELKEKMRKMTIEYVIPPYVQFVEEYCNIPFTRKPSKYLSYNSITMQDMMLKLFDEEREEKV